MELMGHRTLLYCPLRGPLNTEALAKDGLTLSVVKSKLRRNKLKVQESHLRGLGKCMPI